jgi:transcriptional regulator GlxA family with amidase domain
VPGRDAARHHASAATQRCIDMSQPPEPPAPNTLHGVLGAARTIGFLLVPRFTMLAFTSALEPLRMANRLSGQTLYRWRLLSCDGSAVSASNGLSLTVDGALAAPGDLDLLLVCGGVDIEQVKERSLFQGLRRLAQARTPLGALDTGPVLLAQAGLLKGYRCTVHWENMASFREQFPDSILTQELFEIDRDRHTCAGGAAPLDFMLTLIGQHHNKELSSAISEEFLCERIRGRHDRQRVPLKMMMGTSQPRLMEAVALMEANLEEPMSLDELSRAVGLSRRQLERLFQRYLSCAPTRYYLDLRLQKARQLLLQTGLSVVDVALACGFVSAPHFSKCYRDYFGRPPRDERRRRDFDEPRPVGELPARR